MVSQLVRLADGLIDHVSIAYGLIVLESLVNVAVTIKIPSCAPTKIVSLEKNIVFNCGAINAALAISEEKTLKVITAASINRCRRMHLFIS